MSRDLTPREARDRFLSRRKQENTEKTVRSYQNQLTRFVEWAEDEGIESRGDVTGWRLDEYRAAREAAGVAPSTLRGQLLAVKQLFDYCASIDVVNHQLPENVNLPALSKAEESNDTELEVDDASALLSFYRSSRKMFGRPEHAFLEVTWHNGARMSVIRALNLGDFDPDRQTLDFRHRLPTLLENKEESERVLLETRRIRPSAYRSY